MKKIPFSPSIETKIMLPFLLLVIFPVLFVGGISYWSAYKNYSQSMEEKAALSLNQALLQLEHIHQKVLARAVSLTEGKKDSIEFTQKLWKNEMVIVEGEVMLLAPSDPWTELRLHLSGTDQPHGRVILDNTWFHQSYLLFDTYEPWNWRIGILVTINPFSPALTNIQKYTLITIVIASIFVIQATILLAHHIAKPLKRLAGWFDQVRDGQPFHLEKKNEEMLQRKDEVGILVDAFHQMVRQMEERKQMEVRLTRLERLAALGELAAGMAHEIRNPLTGMKTSVQVLQRRIAGNEQNDMLLTGIQSEIERLNRLTIQLVHFAKPQLARLLRVDIRQVLDEVLALLAQPIRDKQIRIEVRQTHTPLFAFYDPDHLKQIYLNLLLNAIKVVPSAEGKIVIHMTENSDELRIDISDNGIGIPPEHADKIFNPFFTTDPKGTGLGLSVVHRLVTEHGGHIDAKDVGDEEQGTVFSFTIPKKRRKHVNEASGHY
ncbi:ATP-binding protein [Paenibacillus naphthalenovorans]|uniref:histidine kinase n=1 Tax=Paenibacillus naphthalenovorans TaxID=162209 RepID=A0A0U2UQ94_9BACL|nr:ATP-binding protein [Paenibacillus naphthalenovorans]ALS25196.1 signal transduction histidine kinase [Paenibacillus naphthalenovorans]